MQGSELLSSLQYILCKYTPMEFTIIKSRAMTLSRSQQCRAFSRAVMGEKSLSPLIPIGGVGAAVTNDWYIKLLNSLKNTDKLEYEWSNFATVKEF